METAALHAFAAGEFDAWAERFARAGLQVHTPARGILHIGDGCAGRARVLLSVGVHGDETAPIELVAGLLDAYAVAPRTLGVDLMVVIGNPDAVAVGQRFVEADLNRMFRDERGEIGSAIEAQRADAIMHATAGFFAAGDGVRWHFDLHTAIRASRYPTFAVVPLDVPDEPRAALLAWLARGGIGAALLKPTQPTAPGTFSAWTATRQAAASATVELGRIGVLGHNDLVPFAPMYRALRAVLAGEPVGGAGAAPHLYRVVRELVKYSDGFRPHFTPETENFAPFAPGSVIAEDGDVTYRAGEQTEYIVFPNPDVRTGLRAGVMVVRA